MIHVLNRQTSVSLADHLHAFIAAHGLRVVLIALIQALIRRRRAQPKRALNMPQAVRRDIGLPPQPEVGRHWRWFR
ncbi:MAG: hypothetical protein AAGJ91_17550 [Pseudomonadota bacterium]